MEDFNEFINGEWERNNSIPEDQSSWNSFSILIEQTNDRLKQVLENAEFTSVLGTFYRTGMDTLNRSDLTPVEKYLNQVDIINNQTDLMKTLARFHKMGVSAVFRIGCSPDSKESKVNRFEMMQGGLSMPDKDYYLSDSFKEKRVSFVEHLATVGMPELILSFETKIANLHRSKVDMRDPEGVYYKFTPTSFQKDIPSDSNFDVYFSELGVTSASCVMIDNPSFFRGIVPLLQSDLEVTKMYLKYRLLDSFSDCMSEENELKYFNFYSKVLTGQETQKPRWKRILAMIEGPLGQLLSKEYIDTYFDPTVKDRVLEMTSNIESEMASAIVNSDWMEDSTKDQALHKLGTFVKKIGWPDVWQDFSELKVYRYDTYLENVIRVNQFHFRKEVLDIIDQPVDKNKWHMNPHAINAYYDPSQNEIVFPAGILQAPFFDPSASIATNYGAIGAVIAHEITHGYDDQGRKYDHAGNLKDWWSESDTVKFNARAKVLVEQYAKYTIHDQPVNGELTLGENLADYGGLTLAYRALVSNHPNEDPKDFFNSWARVWKGLMRKERALQLLTVDYHSPMKYRVACVRNIPEFYTVYGIKESDPIYLEESARVKLW